MPFLLIDFPAFKPIALEIGPFAIRWYALAYICGIVFGWLYARSLLKNERLWGGPAPISLLQVDDFILWVTLGIILGGRTGYVLFYNLPVFIDHPAAIFRLWEGGMSFHGGFLGCVVAVMWFAYRNKIPILSLGDITTAVAPVGLLLGRLANFINGELWGRATDASLPWAMIFPNDPTQLPRHPSQLYEAGMEGILLFTVVTEEGPVAFKVYHYGFGNDVYIARMDITDDWDEIERLSSMVDMLGQPITVPLGGQIDATGGGGAQ